MPQMMPRTLSGLTLALAIVTTSALAGGQAAMAAEGPITLAQGQGINSMTRNTDRPPRPQRYVCVVPPRPSEDRTRPHICRADAGRVGGTCRCDNVVGTGRLDLDD